MKTALVHDWLNGMRGGERCLEAIGELFPESPVFTLFYEKGKVSRGIARHAIHPSGLDRMPMIYGKYRYYLPFFPAAAGSLKTDDYDLLVSTSHCVAKGVKKKAGAVHVCYCFTPMRYAWGFFDEYFGGMNFAAKTLVRAVIPRLRAWDLEANARVDHFVAISEHVRKRIEKNYGRKSTVIYPPCDTDFYTPAEAVPREDFYLAVSALVPYKKIDLAMKAFETGNRTLVVIGDGPERKKLEASASRNVRFLGWKPDEALRDYYRRAKALIFPGEEDFGIVPLEAQACGLPVIAYGRGGALETVKRQETGLFFEEQTAQSLLEAIRRFELTPWDPAAARVNALAFGRERFKNEMKSFIEALPGMGKIT